MTKNRAYLGAILLLLIFGIVTLFYMIHYKSQASIYKEKSMTNHQYYSEKQLTANNAITEGFNTLFNYDNSNFVSRYDDEKKYMTDSVIAKQKGSGGVLQAPQIKIQKKINSLHIYEEMNKGEKVSALVQINSTYTVEGKPNPSVNELYRVNFNFKINKMDSLEYLGALNVVQAS